MENKKLVKMYLNEGTVFQLHLPELDSFCHVMLVLESKIQERRYAIFLSKESHRGQACVRSVPVWWLREAIV